MTTRRNCSFEELGISPSERLMEQFDQMSSQLKHVKPKEIQDIKQRLKEEKGQGGAYYWQPSKLP